MSKALHSILYILSLSRYIKAYYIRIVFFAHLNLLFSIPYFPHFLLVSLAFCSCQLHFISQWLLWLELASPASCLFCSDLTWRLCHCLTKPFPLFLALRQQNFLLNGSTWTSNGLLLPPTWFPCYFFSVWGVLGSSWHQHMFFQFDLRFLSSYS